MIRNYQIVMSEQANKKNSSQAYMNHTRRNLDPFYRYTSYGLGIFLTLFTFYTAFFGVFYPIIQRLIHLSIILVLTYLWYPAGLSSPKNRPSMPDIGIILLIAVLTGYTLYSHDRFMMRVPYMDLLTSTDKVMGMALIGITLEAGRRTLGIILVTLVLVFILYAFLGKYMPIMLAHKGVTLELFVEQMYATTEGLWSNLMGLSATLLYTFLAFGVFLQITRADKFFINLCLGIAGKYRGGPAKVAVIASSAMGSISGSTVANVVTTGSLTIPLMKKIGYAPHEAAAIETAASAGGQIMPPVMGAGVFIMAEVIGTTYLDIMVVSFIPAIFYYTSVWFFVDFRARKRGLVGLDPKYIPSKWETLLTGFHMLIPIALLMAMLFLGYTAFYAGAVSSVSVLIIASLRNTTRASWKEIFIGFEKAALGMVSIGSIIACACIIVSIINMSGLTLKSTAILLHISGNNLIFAILVQALLAYIFGMGLPVVTAYVVLSTLGAPALGKLGVPMLSAHLMIFWFSQLATITPPVCITAFAAAAIANTDPYKTGYTALRFGSPFYFVPLLFIFSDLLQSSLGKTLLFGVIGIFTFYALVCALEGYSVQKLSCMGRIGFFLAFVLLILSMFRIPLPLSALLGAAGFLLLAFNIFMSSKNIPSGMKNGREAAHTLLNKRP